MKKLVDELVKEISKLSSSPIKVVNEEQDVGVWLSFEFDSGDVVHSVSFNPGGVSKVYLNCQYEEGFGSGASARCNTIPGIVEVIRNSFE